MLDKEVSPIAFLRVNNARYSICDILDRIYLGEFLAAPPFNEPYPSDVQNGRKKFGDVSVLNCFGENG
jgi:hypothetical protein